MLDVGIKETTTTTGTGTVTLSAAETGSDTFTASGTMPISGNLSASETGADSFDASGRVVVAGSLSATETGADTFSAIGFGGAVTGTLNASEDGPDTFFATNVSGQSFAAEIDLTRWYVKRGKKLYIFDRAEDADAFIDAESEAQKAVEQAQKTSRRARKRVRASIASPQPLQTVDIDQLSGLLRELDMRVDLPALVAQQDFDRVMEVMARAVKAQADRDDELDIEMLLLA